MVKPNALFNLKTIKKLCTNVTVTPTQRKAATEWLKLLEGGQLEREKQNYFRFALIILKDLLGYPIKEDMGYEEGNVEFTFSNKVGKKIVCFEAKGTGTDLFSSQYREKKEHSTPIKQTWDYMGTLNLDYGVATNYKDFLLIDKSKGTSKAHFLDFTSIKGNDEKLREFIAIFSKDGIIDKKFIDKLYDASVVEEREFTKEFYKLFHETRLMLIKEFQSDGNVSKEEAIHYAQLFLNRLIFIFFAEETGKLPQRLFRDRMLKILDAVPLTEHSKYASDTILALFESLDKGSQMPVHIFGFNGGLFADKIPPRIYFKDLTDPKFFNDVYQYSELKKQIKLDEFAEKIVRSYNYKINPIISNLLLMSSFDFNTELNVNILGHIFEQSLTDLEELQREETLRRKKEGIFYTPDYITEMVCKNTIIPHLSKKRSKEISDLILEYSDNIEELEKKFNEIKILDPACGSGHFLLKAVEVLLEISREIQSFKESQGMYTFTKKGKKSRLVEQFTLTKWNEESEARQIIENNIFGVDINEESVEITKLGLFLKIATVSRKLIDLSKNIKTGNSVVDDRLVDPKAFDWKKEFPEVFKNDGFDIIIGNPPYIRVQLLDHKIIDWLKQNKETAYKRVDISTLFFELAKSILKDKGLVSFITSNQFQVTEYGRRTREFILKNFKIIHIIDFGDLPIFEDALTYVSIFTFQNDAPSNFKYLRVRNIEDAKRIDLNDSVTLDISSLNGDSWTLGDKSSLELLDKLRKYSTIESIGRTGYGLITGLDEVLLLEEDKIKNLRIEEEMLLPVIVGTDPDRYVVVKPSSYVIYPYKLLNDETTLIGEDEFKSKYPNTYKYLLDNKQRLIERKDSRKTFKNRKDWYSLVRFGMLDNFSSAKIITPGEVKDHKFTIDYSKSGFLAARVFCVIVTNNNYDLKYVLAMLNSNVVKFFLHNTAPLKQGGYYGYSSSYLDKVTIPNVDSDTQKKIIVKVDKIFELNHIRKEKKATFLSRLKINLGVNITKKFEDFETMDFLDFIKELGKQKKTLSLKEQDEWEDYFNANKSNLIKFKNEASTIEHEIDSIAYDLYGLTSDEKKFMQEFLNR